MMTPGFTHGPVPSGNIRLVQLDQELLDGNPQLSLESFSRKECPGYTAVSYCWGPDGAIHSLWINGQPFPARPNLFQLLLHLRHHCKEHPEWQYFWIDAICINQVDNEEKGEQVGRMEETYRDASATVVWLGKQSGTNDHGPPEKERTSNIASVSLIDELLANPYWSRMWIIQELMLSKNVVVLYGYVSLKWKDIVGPVNAWATVKPKWRKTAGYKMILMTGRAPYMQEHGYALGELMRRLEYSECTDPRDRIFALLSLTEKEERKLLSAIFPDYTISTEKVMLITMAYLKQVYAPRPFKWVVKPQQVWSHRVFGLDEETWRAMWTETEGYETPHDLTNYTKVWNPSSIGQLLRVNKSAEVFREQKAELKESREEWLKVREDALRRLKEESER